MSEYLIKPKTKRGEITLDKIIQAASEVFYEKGFHGGSISDITQRAGVGNGTFYIYFDSKLSVYRYLLVEYGKRIRAKSSQNIEGCASRKEAERFCKILNDGGISATIRREFGTDIDAACGQLRRKDAKEGKTT